MTTATTTRSILLALAGLALGSLPSFASDPQSLASLYLPHTTITAADELTTGKFQPPTGKPFTNLPPFCRVGVTLNPSPDSEMHGTAPEKLLAHNRPVTMLRPLCAYPKTAQYKGSGNPNDTSQFRVRGKVGTRCA